MTHERRRPIDGKKHRERQQRAECGEFFPRRREAARDCAAGQEQQQGQRGLDRERVGKKRHPAGHAVVAGHERSAGFRELQHERQSVEPRLGQHMPVPQRHDHGAGRAHARQNPLPAVIEVRARREFRCERSEAKTVEQPNDRPRRDGVDERRAREAQERRAPSRAPRLAQSPDYADEGEHRRQEHGGELGHERQTERRRAQRGPREARPLQVPPPRADRGDEEKRHDEVRCRERAVREKGRREGEKPERQKRPAPPEERARPEKHEQPRRRAHERNHPAAEPEPLIGEDALPVEEFVAVVPHVGRAPGFARRGRLRHAADCHRQRGEALRQIAVLRLESKIAAGVVGLPGDEVRDFV